MEFLDSRQLVCLSDVYELTAGRLFQVSWNNSRRCVAKAGVEAPPSLRDLRLFQQTAHSLQFGVVRNESEFVRPNRKVCWKGKELDVDWRVFHASIELNNALCICGGFEQHGSSLVPSQRLLLLKDSFEQINTPLSSSIGAAGVLGYNIFTGKFVAFGGFRAGETTLDQVLKHFISEDGAWAIGGFRPGNSFSLFDEIVEIDAATGRVEEIQDNMLYFELVKLDMWELRPVQQFPCRFAFAASFTVGNQFLVVLSTSGAFVVDLALARVISMPQFRAPAPMAQFAVRERVLYYPGGALDVSGVLEGVFQLQ